ncbi:MAG: hypothetical protein LBJ00_11500 [Planctomycetaceae bacterium]|jgi:hypothetical protein|nr:hypothetical protein [Planctomycetaceae bacterium]
MNKFLFADENPSFNSFFLVAARRAAILFPLAGIISVSAVDVVKLLVLIFWLLAGNWGSRIKICKQNPLALVLVLLVCWTFWGVIQWLFIDPNMFFKAVNHWWSRYSFLCMLILTTLYTDQKTRTIALSVFNAAMVLFCINAIFVWNNIMPKNIPSCFMLFDTITTGVVLVMWSVYWIYYSYQLRNIPIARRITPVSILLGMKVAARTSLFGLLFLFNPFSRVKLVLIWAVLFTLVRWGIVILSTYFVYAVNPSRTAQLAMTVVIIGGIFAWNWRKGLVVFVILLPFIIVMASLSNDYFVKKWKATYNAVNDIITKDVDEIGKIQRDRHWIFAKIIPEIKKKPIAGHGVDVGFEMVKNILNRDRNIGFAHTHCDFTQMALQYGLVSVALLILLLVITIVYASTIPPPINRFAILLVLIMSIDMMFNVPLYFCRQKFVVMFTLSIIFSEILYYRSSRITKKITNE